MVKKKLDKPKLVILTRGRPEEAVLDICKTGTPIIPSNGPNSYFSMCTLWDICLNMCSSEVNS